MKESRTQIPKEATPGLQMLEGLSFTGKAIDNHFIREGGSCRPCPHNRSLLGLTAVSYPSLAYEDTSSFCTWED